MQRKVTILSRFRYHITMKEVSVLLVIIFAVFTSAQDQSNNEYAPMDENYNSENPFGTDEEYFRHIHSMIDAYRGDMQDGPLVIETNALINTKYKTWKRNADIINSLLALPKGMNDAGR